MQPEAPAVKWGELSFDTLANGNIEARAWVRIEGVPKGRYVRAQANTRVNAKRRLLVRLEALRLDPTGSKGKKLQKEQAKDSSPDPLASQTFHDLCVVYLARFDDEVENNETTNHENKRIIKNHLMKSMLAPIPVVDMRAKHVDEWYQPYAKKAPSAARNALVELRKVLDLGVTQGWAELNVGRVFNRTRKRKPTNNYAPSNSELMALHEAAVAYRTREGAMGPRPGMLLEDTIDAILGTSARIGEALGLHWANISLHSETPTVKILGTVIEGHGKPKEYQEYPKTEAGEREIPIPEFLVATLRRRARENTSGNKFVFHTSTGEPVGPQEVQRALQRVRKWSATTDAVQTIPKEMVTRALRKSVATAIAREEGLLPAAKTLGHAQSTVTERNYVKRDLLAPDMRHVTGQLAPWATSRSE